MSTLKSKLSSRKFWAAMAGVVSGLAMIFGLDENIISTVAGAVMALGSVVVYINTEGRIDAASISKAAQAVELAAKSLKAGGTDE